MARWSIERPAARERRRPARGAVSARAAAAMRGSRRRSRHTTPETWAITSTRTPVVTRCAGAHEVSKPQRDGRQLERREDRARRSSRRRIADTPTSRGRASRWSVRRGVTAAGAVRRAGCARAPRGRRDRCSRESPTAGCGRSRAAGCAGRSGAETPSRRASSCAADRRGRSPSTGTSRARRRRRAAGDC